MIPTPTFYLGDHVRKTKGSQWKGRVVGTYSTDMTPEGYVVESDTERGSVQTCPVEELELAWEDSEADVSALVEALEDMLSGWKYIRESHGDLYGVGWDRAESKARAALAAHRKQQGPSHDNQ